jgi:hypothetical protein
MRSVRKLLILAKIEATYGTDVLPAGADAILVTNASLKPLEAEVIDRDFVRSYLGASGKIMAGDYAKLEFSVELAGAGAAGTAPKWGRLARACAMSETITAGVDVHLHDKNCLMGFMEFPNNPAVSGHPSVHKVI